MNFRERARRVIPAQYEGDGWNQARDRAEAEVRQAFEDGRSTETPNPPPSGDIGELVERLRGRTRSVYDSVTREWDEVEDELSTQAATALQSQAAEIERLNPYEDELRKIAEDLGEPDDPFAAWESVAALKARLKDAVKVIEPFAKIMPGTAAAMVAAMGMRLEQGRGTRFERDAYYEYEAMKKLADAFTAARAFISTTGGDSHG